MSIGFPVHNEVSLSQLSQATNLTISNVSSKKQVKSIVCNFVRSSYLLVVTKEEWRCVHMHHTYTHTYIYDKACFAMCKCVCMCKCIFSISCLCLHVLAVIWLARMFLFVIIWKHCYILTSKNSNINRKICHINHKIGGSNDIQAWIHKINNTRFQYCLYILLKTHI